MWDALRGLQSCLFSVPWLVGEDFKVMANLSEYSSRSSPDMFSIGDFQSCINDCSLLDLSFTWSSFTWTGIRSSRRVWKRLDKVMANHAWLGHFCSISVEILSHVCSDHSPHLVCVFVLLLWVAGLLSSRLSGLLRSIFLMLSRLVGHSLKPPIVCCG